VRAHSDGSWQPDAEIPGAIVERGVWRGGSVLAVARTLLELGATDRELYLFDTFEGMPEQTMKDVRLAASGRLLNLVDSFGPGIAVKL
jgi:hypothetical protein